MRPRALAILIPVLLVAACSGAATTPTWSYAPTASAVAVASSTATPTAEPTVEATAPSVAPSASRTTEPLSGEVEVVMSDTMRFAPNPVTVKAGEEITFVVRNEGVIVHEFFVGSEEAQADHAAEMAAGGMSHGHDNALSLAAGEVGSLTMTFADTGSLLIGCHVPGHYDAGMKATLVVAD